MFLELGGITNTICTLFKANKWELFIIWWLFAAELVSHVAILSSLQQDSQARGTKRIGGRWFEFSRSVPIWEVSKWNKMRCSNSAPLPVYWSKLVWFYFLYPNIFTKPIVNMILSLTKKSNCRYVAVNLFFVFFFFSFVEFLVFLPGTTYKPATTMGLWPCLCFDGSEHSWYQRLPYSITGRFMRHNKVFFFF